METKKYIFTGLTKIVSGVVLKQIKRVSDGFIGGWIEKEDNLQQIGDAFVSGNACVYGNARVYGNAHVYGDARVFGDAFVSGNACVSGDAFVYDKMQIINITMAPYSITITPQNIVIGCQLKSRFGKDQWNKKDQDQNLIKIYAPILNVLKKQVPRKRVLKTKEKNDE